jgi:ketosteroid isomerase-like protein
MAGASDPLSTLWQPGAADTGAARAVIREIQGAFREGDYARLAAYFHDDVDWVFYGPPSVFPDVGHRRGKVEVFKAFQSLNAMYRFERHVTDHLIAQGDWAAGVADVKLVQRTSGRVISCKIASFHRVRDGKVIEYSGFTDSFDAAEQVLGQELQL